MVLLEHKIKLKVEGGKRKVWEKQLVCWKKEHELNFLFSREINDMLGCDSLKEVRKSQKK